jgi:pimeloyl-ACP methyl ester carboxylesterase
VVALASVSEGDGSPMARLKRTHFGLRTPFVPPDGEMERRLKDIWEAVLDIDGLGVEDDYFELGGESLAAVTMFAELESQFGEMPPLSILLDCPTIRLLAAHLDKLGFKAANSLLLTVKGDGNRPPLFYTHAAYGNVLFVRRLVPYLEAEQPLHAIQARGLQEGEIAHRSFEAMAKDYCGVIRQVQGNGPYILAGHCVGGLIAYAMAQYLKSQGESVAAVIMIDPDYHPNGVPWLHWKNPSAPHIRLWLQILRPFWFARLWLRRCRCVCAVSCRRNPRRSAASSVSVAKACARACVLRSRPIGPSPMRARSSLSVRPSAAACWQSAVPAGPRWRRKRNSSTSALPMTSSSSPPCRKWAGLWRACSHRRLRKP